MTRHAADPPSRIPPLHSPIDRRTALGVLLAPIVAGCTDAFGPRSISPELNLGASGDGVLLVGAGDPHALAANAAYKTGQIVKAMLNAEPNAWAFALGDLVENGTAQEYRDYYERAWGAFKNRTLFSIGNHDRKADPTATPYYDYLGELAGPRGKGYYAKTLGAWRCYFLNSEVPSAQRSEQTAWLRADLPLWSNYHIMAMWHTPMFASNCFHGDTMMAWPGGVGPWWQLLQDHGAEFVVSGHVHRYERFTRMLRDGTASERGIRQFIVGTGGAGLMNVLSPHPRSQRRVVTKGVVRFVLHRDRYEWSFSDLSGVVRDSGTQLTRRVAAV